MAIKRGFRFPIESKQAFPKGVLLLSEIGPAIKYNPDRNAPAEQERDFDLKTGEGSGLPMWSATVTDRDETKAKRASFEIKFISAHQPVPAGLELSDDLWLIELEGLTAEPRVMGQGDFKYLGYVYRATGIKGDTNTPKPAATGNGAGAKAGA